MTFNRLYTLTSIIPFIVNEDKFRFSENTKTYIMKNLDEFTALAEAWTSRITNALLKIVEENKEEDNDTGLYTVAFALRQLEVAHKALVENNELDVLMGELSNETVFKAVEKHCGYAIHKEIIKLTCEKALEKKTSASIKCERVLKDLDKQAEYLQKALHLPVRLEKTYEEVLADDVTAETLDKVLRILR